jgi:protein-disulfide isomerase
MRLRLGVFGLFAVFFVTSGPSAHADVPRTDDGYGVLLGSPDAPLQLEVFCEPQCPHCAQFESTYGEQIADDLDSGRLAVTYRWLTFLDDAHHNDASARISNALFLAVGPSTSPTAYQAFVQDLYRHQGADGPDNNGIAAMARESGLPAAAASRMAAGEPAVDVAAMNNANTALLTEENSQGRITPTVFDLNTLQVVDLQDPDWLAKLAD